MLDAEYKRLVENRVREAISGTQLAFRQMVRSCRGAYPTIVLQVLKDLDVEKTIHRAELFGKQGRSSRDDSLGGSVLSDLEANPVLSSWYFTGDTCRRFELLRPWIDVAIVFLGTPRLYEWFARRKIGSHRTLLELDEAVVGRLRALSSNSDNEVVLLDIRGSIPERLLGQFQVAVLDPPWYPDDYAVWLRRAISLAPRGVLYVSLFPELTRPLAERERAQILDELSACSRSLSVVSGCLEYEIPSFERYQLKASGIVGLDPWKLSDLILCELRESVHLPDLPNSDHYHGSWQEADYGALRIFIRDDVVCSSDGVLLSEPKGTEITLPSPSRREKGFGEINVLTSRGDGLLCSRPQELLSILRNLIDLLTGGRTLASEIRQLTLDQPSKRLLRRLLHSDG